MNNMKKLLAALLVVSMVLAMTGCKNNEDPSNSSGGNVSGETTAYNVSIQSAGKLPLEGINVEVYEDGNLVNVATTDAEGKVAMNMAASDNYTIKLSNVKKGYEVLESYTFTGSNTAITLNSKLVQDESMSGATFSLGDVMYDFELTDVDGTTWKLSEMLEEKDMVLLNVFYTTCSPCNSEMPYMQEAYSQYEDKVGVVAISPYGGDTEVAVRSFRDTYGLTFPTARVANGWSTLAVDGAYPTSYVIDRYGVVCLVEVGALTSLRPFTSIFEHFTAEDYETKLITSLDEIVTKVEPTVEDTDPEEIATVLGNAEGNLVYSNETENVYTWPFVTFEKDGETVMKASNSGIEDSYAIMYVDVTLKKGQAIAFDYLISSESGCDLFHVIVDDTPIYNMSGVDETPTWKSCYPWVAQKDGTYHMGLTYIKDESDNAGDDTVYLKNFRIIDASEIDTASYIPMDAAVSTDGFNYEYETIVYNEADGYYHVGTVDGPLLLANLQGVTQLYEDNSIYLMALDGTFGDTMATRLTPYASYATNSKMTNYCTVTQELAELLQECVSIAGFEDNDMEWLKVCKYYAAYGTNGAQMEDPIEGLATFSAFEAKLGTNEIPYLEGLPIMPRGKYAKFVPTTSGVYKVTTTCDPATLTGEMHGFIFGDNYDHLIGNTEDTSNIIAESLRDQRWIEDGDNFVMYAYLEAGKSYYINLFFYDPYAVGTVTYNLEWMGATYDHLRQASPGPWTAELLPGDELGATIPGGITPIFNEATGYYHHDLGLDANGNQIYGSIIYADFYGSYTVMANAIVGAGGILELGGFDRSKSEDDKVILTYIEMYDGDREKVEAALKEHWTEDYYQSIQKVIDEVFDGIYHGEGEDYSALIEYYRDNVMIKSGEMEGLVPVDKQLAELLDGLVNDYIFENVLNGWIKFCYYIDSMG